MWWLVILGIFGRLWQFGAIPDSLYWDEIAIGLDARSILQTGKDLVGNSWLQPFFVSYGDFKAPVYIWLVTLFGRFFSVNEWVIRLPSLLASFGTGWLIYKLFGRLAAVSFLIMPWALHFSRIGFESHLSLFWLTLMVWLVLKKNYLAALAGVAGIYSYISLRLMAPVLFLSFAWKKGVKYWMTGLLIMGLGILMLTSSPQYAASQQYRLSNDNLITSTLSKPEKARQFLSNYFDFFEPEFLLGRGDPNLRHHSGFGGELLLIQGLLVIVGLTANPDKLMLVWLFLAPAVAALVNETPHASRAIYMIVPLAYLAGLGWQRLARKKSAWVIPLVLGINFLIYAHDYFIHYPARSADNWIRPYKEAAQKQYDRPVYISSRLYKPELYFAFYQNDLSLLKSNDRFYYYVPAVCPAEAICLSGF